MLLRHLTYDRPSEKGRAEKLQWHVLSSLKGIQSRNCHCSEDIFILAEITTGNPLSSTPVCCDRGMAVSCCAGIPGVLGWRQGQQPEETMLSASVRHTWQSTPLHLTQVSPTPPLSVPTEAQRLALCLGGSFIAMFKEVMAGSHK